MDTNMMFELISDLDVTRAFEENDEDLTKPEPLYRLRRARAAMLAVMVLHERGMGVLGHFGEVMRKLAENGPPAIDSDNPGVLEWSQAFAKSFVNFVMPHVLPGWSRLSDDEEPDVHGDDADLWLQEQALKFAVPLITNEGVTPRGFTDTYRRRNRGMNLRGRARQAGVSVMSPIEFFWRSYEPARPMIDRFIARFVAEGPGYARTQPDVAGEMRLLQDHLNLYRLFLLGTTVDGMPDLDVEWPR